MPTASDRVLITILNFNGWEETLPCMDTVLSQSHTNYHVLLIDNGSADESIEKLAHFESHDKVTLLKNPDNLGFAGGVNIGINHAIEHDYPYIALLNNDALLTKTWLETVIGSLKKHQVSSVTGLLLNGDGTKIESTGDSYSIWGLPFPRQRDEPVEVAEESGLVFNGTAGASLYTTALFKDIGLFDEKFFAYFEDTDIGMRAQLAGHKSYYDKSAIANHEHGTTSGKMPGFTVYQTFKNTPLIILKDIPSSMLLGVGGRFFVIYWLLFIRAVLRGQFIVASKGVLRSITLIPHALRQRRVIQRKRSVSIGYLRSVIYPELPPANKRYINKLIGR